MKKGTVKSNECRRRHFLGVEGGVTPLRNGNPTPSGFLTLSTCGMDGSIELSRDIYKALIGNEEKTKACNIRISTFISALRLMSELSLCQTPKVKKERVRKYQLINF